MNDESQLPHVPGYLSALGLAISGFFAKGYVGRIQELEKASQQFQTKDDAAETKRELREDIHSLRDTVETGFRDLQRTLSNPPRSRR